MSKEEEPETVTAEQVALFEATEPLLEAMAEDFRKLASKKPETTLSKTKVSFVNRLLTDLQSLLVREPTIKYLDLLPDEDLPQYSDVVLILSQHKAAMAAFKTRYRHYSSMTGSHEWDIEEMESEEDFEDEGDNEIEE